MIEYRYAEGKENLLFWPCCCGTLVIGRLRELFESAGRNKRVILPPDTYSEVAVVFADQWILGICARHAQ